MFYSGKSNGTLAAQAAFVTPDFRFDAPDYDDTDGCESADFIGKDVADKIAIIQRGGCSFSTKVVNAQNAGAKGVIVFNQGNGEGRTSVVNGTLGATIPAFGARYELGKQWYDLSKTTDLPVSLQLNVQDDVVLTQNIIAETKGGDENQVVMLGAHLDSVPEGPGINDNGSGTAGLLEYAVTLANLNAPVKNKVRFAWWAAEEAEQFGGQIDVAYDKCYHQACDDLNNISQTALYVNTQSLAYVTTFYAFSQPVFPQQQPEVVPALRTMDAVFVPQNKLRVGEKLKAADSVSDHDHFHGDFDQDRQ